MHRLVRHLFIFWSRNDFPHPRILQSNGTAFQVIFSCFYFKFNNSDLACAKQLRNEESDLELLRLREASIKFDCCNDCHCNSGSMV